MNAAQLIAACRANPAPLSTWEETFLEEMARASRPASERQIETLQRIAARVSLDEIAARLADRIEDLAHLLTGGESSTLHGDRRRFRGKGSLVITVHGPQRGTWFDHDPPASGRPVSANGAAGGDALDLVAHLRGCDRADAAAWARGWLGLSDGGEVRALPPRPVAPPERPRAASGTGDHARRTWREAVPATGTLVETYLASRGLTLPADAPIRFHPACPRGAERLPAMVALMTDPATGGPCGVHRTLLRADGGGKADGTAKMMLGNAGVIRLVPDEDVTLGLGVAEGIETALSVMKGFGWRPVWAATSAGGIRAFPVLPGVECLTVFADPEEAGMAAAEACADRWQAAGREARICHPPAGDFNDLVREVAA
jgi:putative DNA primase/helicase